MDGGAATVEALIAARPDVAAAALVRAGTGTILAVEPRGHCAAVDIRDELWALVPAVLLPDLVLVVPELPRDATGAVRTVGVAAELLDTPGACGFMEPVTPTEVELAVIWRHVLGRPRIAMHDDLFDLGGDSVSATLLVDLINARFGVDLSVDELLDRPSPHAVTRAIERRRRAS